MKKEKSTEGILAKITLTIRAGTIAFLLAVMFVLLFICLPGHRDILKFAAGVIAAAGAVTSAFYIGQNLRQATASEKMSRTITYTARWNDPQFFYAKKDFRGIMEDLLQRKEQDPQKDRLVLINELISEEPDREQNLISVLNFLEELAILINRDVVDEEILDEFYHTVVVKCYSNLEPWIRELRSKRGERIFGDLIKLYERWASS